MLQPSIGVQKLDLLMELLLQGVPQQQLATLLALCQQARSVMCGFKSEGNILRFSVLVFMHEVDP